jgi:uncharacterized membrane protein
MELFIFLLGLLILAFPIMTIVALVKASDLGRSVRVVERRLALLEQQFAGIPRGAASPETPAQPPSVESDAISPPEPGEPEEQSEPPTPDVTTPEPAGESATPPTPPSLPPPPSRPTAPPPPSMGFEERFGTQWVVWVGGVALALGGIFLVQYTIEQGLIGPRVRIALGALLAAALIAAGEWARRSEQLSGIAGVPKAHIPSILTAAGTVVAYADVYAAYRLYDFLAPGSAFILLALVALATLAAALLHGPALAGLGLVGAYVVPLLVSTVAPNYWALYIYLAVVTGAAFALARIRLWRWLAITAVVFGVLWLFPGLEVVRLIPLGAHVFHVVAGFVLAAAFLVSGLLYGPEPVPGRISGVSSGALAAYLFGAAIVVMVSRHDMLALVAFAALVAATVATAWRAESAVGAVPAAALLVAVVFVEWAVIPIYFRLVLPPGPVEGSVPGMPVVFYGRQLLFGAGFAVLFGAAGFLAQGRSERPIAPMLWSAAAVFTPLAVLAALYFRIANFERSIPFAALALLLAALYGLATEVLGKRVPRPGLAAAGAIFATGAVAALALALTMALERGWLTVALALMVPGIAWISLHRPLPALRWLAAIVVVLVLARIAWEPRIVGDDVGTTPFFNWLLYGYGIPALAFWYGGYLLRQRADDVPTRSVEAAAILFTVLFAVLQIRHFMTNGEVFRNSTGLAEVALQVCVGLALTIGLERLRLRTRSIVHDFGTLVIAALTLVAIVLGLCLAENPLFTGRPVGGLFFNLILLGYGIPAVLCAVVGLTARGLRPQPYSAVAAVTAVVLAILYLSLQVTRFYHGPVLTVGPTTDAEQYTYSAVWLTFGVALLAVGVLVRSQPVRFASAAVVILTVLKVFLADMAGLTGIYQSLSFIGLGVVLLGIGWFYQRLLFPRRPPPSLQAT